MAIYLPAGAAYYGYIDQVDDEGHVATLFVHIAYVPLIPVRGVFLLGGDADRAVRIPMSPRSVLSAWFRTVFVLHAVLAVLVSVLRVMKLLSDADLGLVIVTAGCLLAAWLVGAIGASIAARYASSGERAARIRSRASRAFLAVLGLGPLVALGVSHASTGKPPLEDLLLGGAVPLAWALVAVLVARRVCRVNRASPERAGEILAHLRAGSGAKAGGA